MKSELGAKYFDMAAILNLTANGESNMFIFRNVINLIYILYTQPMAICIQIESFLMCKSFNVKMLRYLHVAYVISME